MMNKTIIGDASDGLPLFSLIGHLQFTRKVIFMNYEDLRFIPLLNGCSIIGDRTFADYGLVPMSSSEVSEICLEIFGYVM